MSPSPPSRDVPRRLGKSRLLPHPGCRRRHRLSRDVHDSCSTATAGARNPLAAQTTAGRHRGLLRPCSCDPSRAFEPPCREGLTSGSRLRRSSHRAPTTSTSISFPLRGRLEEPTPGSDRRPLSSPTSRSRSESIYASPARKLRSAGQSTTGSCLRPPLGQPPTLSTLTTTTTRNPGESSAPHRWRTPTTILKGQACPRSPDEGVFRYSRTDRRS